MTIDQNSIPKTPEDVEALLQQGLTLQRHGQLAEAKAIYESVLATDAKHFGALNLLGVVAAQAGNLELAAEWMGKALEIVPNRAPLHFNRGAVLQQLKRTEEAVDSFQCAIAIKPEFAEAHFNLGIALRTLHRNDEALTCFQRTISIEPGFTDAHMHVGDLLQECKCTEEALSSYERAIVLMPDCAEAHFNRGVVLQDLQRLEDALGSYDRAIAIKPDYAAAFANRGVALHRLKRSEGALASFDRAIEIKPDSDTTHSNRGIALHELHRTQEALASYETAIALNPNSSEPLWNKALALLSLGNFEEGWRLYEWRWKRTNAVTLDAHYHHLQPPWLGDQALAGKTILLHAEQGLGDTIQLCRYARLVKAMGATVILEVPKPLAKLLSGLEGVDRVVDQGDAPLSFDFHCPLLSLPLACKTGMDTIPRSAKYLFASPQETDLWQQRLGTATRPRIGLVWSGGYRPAQPELWAVNERRNLPFELLGMLKGLDVDFISLQKGEPAESEFATAVRAGWNGPIIANYSADLRDFSETAALIENLDLVISVDTSVAHLAAALGKPVWILNRFDSCWRWLQNRTDSPWYPTVKLYNQERPGDWELVMRRVRQDLFDLGA